jgi:CubicO group peptidase (beta-lactamase class C family)
LIDEALVERVRERWGVPGMVLGLLDGGDTLVRAFGEAGPEDRFHVASLTKPMVAHACFELGLPLDEPLWEDCTLRHCLAHRTGIDGEPEDPLRFGAGDDATERIVGELGTLRRWGPAPMLWSYANVGYWVAGLECARRADATFEDTLARLVFEPLGMAQTGFEGATLAGLGEEYPRARRPSGGVVSTAGDLLHFAERHLAPHPSHERQTEAIDTDWALGWGCTRTFVYHPGNWGGYTSILLVSTERRWAFVALANAESGTNAITAIVDELLGRNRPARAEAPLDDYAGTYRRHGAQVTFRSREGGLEAESLEARGRAARVWGYPVSPTRFFIPDGEGRGSSFDFPLPGFTRFGSRLAERV